MQQFNIRDTLKHTNEHVERILSTLGPIIQIDEQGYLCFEKIDGPSILVEGDDSWGNVISMFTADGHLVLVVNFGDDGDTLYSPTTNDTVTNDIPDELRNLIDGDDSGSTVDVYVNKLSSYSVSSTFNC